MKALTSINISLLPTAAGEIIKQADEYKIWLFEGDMGAGKTTLIKAVCAAMGVEDLVSSPTFSLVNEYEAGEEVIYHFDFYRMKNEEEAMDIGVEEYFYSGNYCFLEWPSKIISLVPEKFLRIFITVNEDDTRTIQLVKHEKT